MNGTISIFHHQVPLKQLLELTMVQINPPSFKTLMSTVVISMIWNRHQTEARYPFLLPVLKFLSKPLTSSIVVLVALNMVVLFTSKNVKTLPSITCVDINVNLIIIVASRIFFLVLHHHQQSTQSSRHQYLIVLLLIYSQCTINMVSSM